MICGECRNQRHDDCVDEVARREYVAWCEKRYGSKNLTLEQSAESKILRPYRHCSCQHRGDKSKKVAESSQVDLLVTQD